MTSKKEHRKVKNSQNIKTGNLFMCSDCGKILKAKGELTHHINSKCGTVKLFDCKVCSQKLMTAGSLYNHTLLHKEKPNFMCRFCAKMFVTAGQLKIHERSHTQEKPYICEVCNKGFCHRQSLITHSTLHTGIKPFQCEGCGSAFSCIGNLLKHRRTHIDPCGLISLTSHKVENPSTKIKVQINTPDTAKLKKVERKRKQENILIKDLVKVNKGETKTYMEEQENTHFAISTQECSLDPNYKKTHTPSNTNENKLISNDDILESDCANSHVFNDKDNITGYENTAGITVNDSDPLDIPYEYFNEIDVSETGILDGAKSPYHKNKINITLQENSKGKAGKQKIPHKKKDALVDENILGFIKERNLEKDIKANCGFCKKEYTNFTFLYRHEQKHMQFKCSCCQKSFASKEECKAHEQITQSKLLTCNDCEKSFATRDSFRKHQRIVHKGVPRKSYAFICEKCGQKFTQKSIFLLHSEKKCGTNKSSFQCKICQKEYYSNRTLHVHMRVHTKEKNFKCNFCGKSFYWSGQHKLHERTHTGEKPYTCLFCPRTFAYRESLITHSSTHTGIKPYVCKCCGQRFSCVGNLAKHRRTHASTCEVR